MPLAPIVKWVGGKTKLLPEIRARMPSTYRRYYEPFLGGGALFFDLEPETPIVGDMNPALIEMYITVGAHTAAVIECLVEMRQGYREGGEEYYYKVREAWNAGTYTKNVIQRAAAFILLNKTCFNGLWRVNKAGAMNVPAGKYKNPSIFDADALKAVAPLLCRTQIKNLGYEKTTETAGGRDFVYFDPPYDPIDKTSNFTAYTQGGFGDKEQGELAVHARMLRDRGAYVLLSNNDTPFIRALYADFKIDVVRCARPINSKGDKRGEVNEVLITGAP